MSKRKSIYLSTEAEEIISRGSRPGNFSGRLNSIVIRYAGMVAEAMPELTQAEWSAVVDANNSSWLEADHRGDLAARAIWLNVDDSGPDGLAEKWGVDLHALAEKIRAMSYAQQVAIVSVVQNFWTSDDLNKLSIPELLKQAGASIKK